MSITKQLIMALAGISLAMSSATQASAHQTRTVEGRAIVATDLNMRRGPGVNYRVIATIPGGTSVRVYGCVRGYSWCQVDYAGRRGWSSARYLRNAGTRDEPLSRVGPQIGLEILEFVLGQIDEGREPPRRGRPAPDQVCFYEHNNFEGERFCTRIGQADRRIGGTWNDRISSIRVGAAASVRVCEHYGFDGLCDNHTGNVPRLGSGWNDSISSYQVRTRAAGEGESGDGRRARVCFFENYNYGGAQFCANRGDTRAELSGDWNDRISSIRVSGGARLQVCEHFHFDGGCQRIGDDVPRLTGGWNDTISSYRVR